MVKQRSVGMCILWSILTCGIYGIYWFICLTNETNAVARTNDTSGGMAVLFTLLTCGIYGWYWAYRLGQKLDIIAQQHGKPSGSNNILFIILTALGLGIVVYCIAQSELNQYANG